MGFGGMVGGGDEVGEKGQKTLTDQPQIRVPLDSIQPLNRQLCGREVWVHMCQVGLLDLLRELDLQESPREFIISRRPGSNNYINISMEEYRLKCPQCLRCWDSE